MGLLDFKVLLKDTLPCGWSLLLAPLIPEPQVGHFQGEVTLFPTFEFT